jgi:hypothetical protein
MQRWIAVAVVVMVLGLGGAGYACWTYKQNRPAPLWVPLPVNPERTDEELTSVARDLKAKLDRPEVLIQVSKDLDLTHKWNLSSNEAAASEISKRLFVSVGEADTPTGKVPSINIGVDGKVNEMKVSGEIAMRLMKETYKLLGIKPSRAE